LNISVCMATYNGGKYIARQIDSILRQLKDEDELIICDDCSSDDIISIINNYNDLRIKLIENPIRLGVIKNFEKCIRHANNEFVFLADQDDIWMPDKVEKALSIFSKFSNVTLLLSNAQIINETDIVVKDHFLEFFKPVNIGFSRVIRNIIKNNYLGAAIAFRKNMTKYILPIPPDVPMHDMWIGIINDIYGKTYYLNEPLIQYRRHSGNATSDKHASLRMMVKWRCRLVKRLLERSMSLFHKLKQIGCLSSL
jgi:glycosyltransferase involved in cell wall biosynthesis